MEVGGINYKTPKVTILGDNGLGVCEIAARTCYDSFDNSENEAIRDFDNIRKNINGERGQEILNSCIKSTKNIDGSELLSDLSWVYFHSSILEHTSINFHVNKISRAVLQELARHRIASYSVRSTRYTMSRLINAYIASTLDKNPLNLFLKIMKEEDIFITTDKEYNELQYIDIFNKLEYQRKKVDNFIYTLMTKKAKIEFDKEINSLAAFKTLNSMKQKRNVGDNVKHIVNDNWSVDLVMTFNLRSLKNFLELRDSGAAWFQIRWLAEEIIKQLPKKYLKLIHKKFKDYHE